MNVTCADELLFPEPELLVGLPSQCSALSVSDAHAFQGWSLDAYYSEFIVIDTFIVERIGFVVLPATTDVQQCFRYMVGESRFDVNATMLSSLERDNIRYYTLPVPLRVAPGTTVRIWNSARSGDYGFIHPVRSASRHVRFRGCCCGRGTVDATFALGDVCFSVHQDSPTVC